LVREDVQLAAHLDAGATCVKIHAGQLEQLIMNLVVNARDAMPGGGTVTIQTRCVHLNEASGISHGGVLPGRYVLLSVSDTGCGMDAEVRTRIFEPFFTTKQRGKGTGLGLSTVYGIVTQNAGGIWLESQPGIGTTFSLCLPVAERKVYPAIAQADLTPSKGTENVLLAEDEADLRKLISNQLGKLGYRVMEAGNGVEALSVAMNTSQTIDLLVSDMIMPRMGGQELSERIRTLYPKVKILQITGYSETPQPPADLSSCGIRYLQKPFTLDSLAAAVRQALDH
jgi:two-component system cell cycle sensor histidine kinase/response regulator CckA